jgi:alpha-L-rhamnosidase
MDTASDAQEDASMISYNHYAYGAVIDWVYRNVAGLAPVVNAPAYRKVVVAPKPAAGFSFAEASIDTRFGNLAIRWDVQQSGDLAIKLEVPFGSEAALELPATGISEITIDGVSASNGSSLTHGSYLIVITNPEIIEYQ